MRLDNHFLGPDLATLHCPFKRLAVAVDANKGQESQKSWQWRPSACTARGNRGDLPSGTVKKRGAGCVTS